MFDICTIFITSEDNIVTWLFTNGIRAWKIHITSPFKATFLDPEHFLQQILRCTLPFLSANTISWRENVGLWTQRNEILGKKDFFFSGKPFLENQNWRDKMCFSDWSKHREGEKKDLRFVIKYNIDTYGKSVQHRKDNLLKEQLKLTIGVVCFKVLQEGEQVQQNGKDSQRLNIRGNKYEVKAWKLIVTTLSNHHPCLLVTWLCLSAVAVIKPSQQVSGWVIIIWANRTRLMVRKGTERMQRCWCHSVNEKVLNATEVTDFHMWLSDLWGQSMGFWLYYFLGTN